MRCLFVILIFALIGCASHEVKPDGRNVRVGREKPRGGCEELDQVIGTSSTSQGAYERAMTDLKRETAYQGGNYVRILAVSTHGSAIRGIAYSCN